MIITAAGTSRCECLCTDGGWSARLNGMETDMNTRETTEIRELTATELEQVTGGSLMQYCATGKHFKTVSLDSGAPSFGSSWGTNEAAGQPA
jgi:hypothetical protein